MNRHSKGDGTERHTLPQLPSRGQRVALVLGTVQPGRPQKLWR